MPKSTIPTTIIGCEFTKKYGVYSIQIDPISQSNSKLIYLRMLILTF